MISKKIKSYRAFGFWWRISYWLKYTFIDVMGVKINSVGKRKATRFKWLFKLLVGEVEWDTKDTASYHYESKF